MEFKLLGPFEVRHDGQLVQLGGRRQERCLLAILLLEAGRIVPIDRLVDLLWDGDAPDSARAVVHTYVGRLRTALDPYDVAIRTKRGGYLVEADGHTVDVDQFTDLAYRAAGTGDPTTRIRLCDKALDLWRGPLLAGLADDALRQRLDGTLTDLRLATTELRADAQLGIGQPDRVVAGLIPLAQEHPTRERLVAHLMTALYRCGRQADALHLYELTGKALGDDLGIEPGPELRTVHERILSNDPRMDQAAVTVYEVRVRDQSLPWAVGGHPALEFCNTYAGWGGPRMPGAEWLRSYPALAVWTGYQDLTDDHTVTHLLRQAQRDPLGAAAVLDEARELRANIYACLTNADDGRAFEYVARCAEAAAKVSAYARDADGLGRWVLSREAGLRLPVHAAARSAAELLGDPRRFTVRTCPSPRCGWLFIDPSGRRRWCSVATCCELTPEECARR
jgi:DNA-binding SARP family transcriptional activator/predicted RNA-binding Zn ribbon-like protein